MPSEEFLPASSRMEREQRAQEIIEKCGQPPVYKPGKDFETVRDWVIQNPPAFMLKPMNSKDFWDSVRWPKRKTLDTNSSAHDLLGNIWPVRPESNEETMKVAFESDGSIPGYNFNSKQFDYSASLGKYCTCLTPAPLRKLSKRGGEDLEGEYIYYSKDVQKHNKACKYLQRRLLPLFTFSEPSVLLMSCSGNLYLLPPLHYHPQRSLVDEIVQTGRVQVGPNEFWEIYSLTTGYFWYNHEVFLLEEDASIVIKTPPERMDTVDNFLNLDRSFYTSLDKQLRTDKKQWSRYEEDGPVGWSEEVEQKVDELLAMRPLLALIADKKIESNTRIMRQFVEMFYNHLRHHLHLDSEQALVDAFEIFCYYKEVQKSGSYTGPSPPYSVLLRDPEIERLVYKKFGPKRRAVEWDTHHTEATVDNYMRPGSRSQSPMIDRSDMPTTREDRRKLLKRGRSSRSGRSTEEDDDSLSFDTDDDNLSFDTDEASSQISDAELTTQILDRERSFDQLFNLG